MQLKLTIISIIISFKVFSQSLPEIKTSGQFLRESASFSEKEQYDQALEQLEHISKNDTNYVEALICKINIHNQKKEFKEAKALAIEGLQITSFKKTNFYRLLSLACYNLKEFELGLSYLDKGIQEFPNFSIFYQLKGVQYYGAGNINEAVKHLQKAIQINFYNEDAHRILGIICLEQNQPSRGTLSILTTLSLFPNNSNAKQSVILLEKYITNARVINTDSIFIKVNEDFEETDLILESQISLNKNFKLKTSLDFKVTRQIQALLEKLKFEKDSDDFWMKNYVPFFNTILEEKERFDENCQFWFSSVGGKLSDKKSQKFRERFNEFNLKKIESRNLFFNNKHGIYSVGFENNSQELTVVVENYDIENKILNGYTEYYHKSHFISASGNYDEKGIKIGEWKYYNEDGTLREISKINPKDSILEYKVYFKNGGLNYQGFIKEQKEYGDYKSYYMHGGKKYEIQIENGLKNGLLINYFPNGVLKEESHYIKGNYEGVVKVYFPNGNLELIKSYKDGKSEGEYKSYYVNGQLKESGVFNNGENEGEWNYYDKKGNLTDKIFFKNGKLNGQKKSYLNKILVFEGNYNEGKDDGLWKYYDVDGKIYATELYDKTGLKSVTYFNKKGEQTSISNRSGGILDLTTYFPSGEIKTKGKFSSEKGWLGKTVRHFLSGGIEVEYNYKDGILVDVSKTFDIGGNILSEVFYQNDHLNGYAKYYYPNGRLSSEGLYVENKKQNEWKTYHPNGILKSLTFYIDDNIQGHNLEYNYDGKLESDFEYLGGDTKNGYYYDSLGNVYSEIKFSKINEEIKIKNFRNELESKTNYMNGLWHGKSFHYGPNGNIIFESDYNNGLKNGALLVHDIFGNLKTKNNYLLNLDHGNAKAYYDNGKLMYDFNYYYGDADSIGTWFYYDGKIETTISQLNGVRNGPYTFYNQDGKTPVYILNYLNDNIISYSSFDKSGKWNLNVPVVSGTFRLEAFYPNGKKLVNANYINSQKHSLFQRYFNNGNLLEENNYEYGISEGIQKSYFSNGKLRESQIQVFDIKTGKFLSYYENGQLKSDIDYVNDKFHGNVIYYDENGQVKAKYKYYHGTLL